MVPWLVLFGIVLVPTACFLLWSWRASRNDMALMRATETTRAADVAKLPAGSLVEVKGRLRCASPVTGELSKSPCAHFVATVERDYEVFEYDAKRQTSYRARKTEIVQSSTLFAPSRSRMKAAGLPSRPLTRSSKGSNRSPANMSKIGNESVMQAALGSANDPERTLGFRYKEMHLPLDVEVYVLGVVGENRCIGAPGRRQGAALPHQRQLGGGARGGARHQEPMDARAWRCLSDWRRRLSRIGLLVGADGV